MWSGLNGDIKNGSGRAAGKKINKSGKLASLGRIIITTHTLCTLYKHSDVNSDVDLLGLSKNPLWAP